MQITLTPHGEELLKQQLEPSAGSSPEEIVERALETLAEEQQPAPDKKDTRRGCRRPQVLMAFILHASAATLAI